MFLQVIQGPVDDEVGLQRQMERWKNELQPGAMGYLGSTFGVTTDGRGIGFASFESATAAKRNSTRPEQDGWWNETQKYYSGDVKFRESEDTEMYLNGITEHAGFVQVMQGRITDRPKLVALEAEMMEELQKMRPDLLGSMRAHHGDGYFTDFSYFTSEAEARAGESQPMPEDSQNGFEQWQNLVGIDTWYDLPNPWINRT